MSLFVGASVEIASNNMEEYLNPQIPYVKVIPEVIPDEPKEEEKQKCIIVEATAYTRSISEGTSRGITKSGTLVSHGTIAVDPRIIPLGTKLYVEGYGYGTALDTGGAIKRNRIDVYFSSKHKALEWGRKTVKVWIVE